MCSSRKTPHLVQDCVTIDNQIDPTTDEMSLTELRSGLAEVPKRIPTKFFYDERDSQLFEEITELDEYYLTRAEHSLLRHHAPQIQTLTGCEELVELGAGAATKTRLLLDAMQSAGKLQLYVPFDFSESEVRRVAEELSDEYPDLRVHGIVADFVHHPGAIPKGTPRLILLLGSTIGNFPHQDAIEFLRRIRDQIESCDYFLLGVDLIKDISRLESAYNDRSGTTAEFNRNILRVVNSFADADFRPEEFNHLAFYNSKLQRIERHLVATRAMSVHFGKLDLKVEIQKGETLHTEISCKYDRPLVESMLSEAGFQLTEWFSDPEDLFALAMARRNC